MRHFIGQHLICETAIRRCEARQDFNLAVCVCWSYAHSTLVVGVVVIHCCCCCNSAASAAVDVFVNSQNEQVFRCSAEKRRSTQRALFKVSNIFLPFDCSAFISLFLFSYLKFVRYFFLTLLSKIHKSFQQDTNKEPVFRSYEIVRRTANRFYEMRSGKAPSFMNGKKGQIPQFLSIAWKATHFMRIELTYWNMCAMRTPKKQQNN